MSTTTRASLYYPLRDERGDLLLYARVRVYQEDGSTLFTEKLFRDGTSQETHSNPFVAAPGLVTFYLEQPARIVLGIVTDLSLPERQTKAIDVLVDADEHVGTEFPMRVTGDWSVKGLLSGFDAATAFWKPLRVDHEHISVAPSTVLLGASPLLLHQMGSFSGTLAIGTETGGWGAATTLKDAVAIGSGITAYGRGGVALGRRAEAVEDVVAPWHSSSVAVGREALGVGGGIGVGPAATATVKALAVGVRAQADAAQGVALGSAAQPSLNGIAIGASTGALSRGMPGSIGLGAGAQYGLPSSVDPGDTSVLLGAFDPTRTRVFPWVNPSNSQSESPFDEFSPTMTFTGSTIQLQRGLEWVVQAVALQVQGDATLAGSDARLGFYGAMPVAQTKVATDEPYSGIEALDNLIYALRDLNLIGARSETMIAFRSEDLRGRYLDGDRVAAWPERFGYDTARSVPGTPPVYRALDAVFNGQASVLFDNSVAQRVARPISELRGNRLLPNAKHMIVVAQHNGAQFGLNESPFALANLSRVLSADLTVLEGQIGSGTWLRSNTQRLEIDGLDQTGNLSAKLPGPHAYSVTNPGTWPHARPVIGGPRDNSSGFDRWSGKIVEVTALDSTWDPVDVRSLADGLRFKYGIGQDPSVLINPAREFILQQHDPQGGALVYLHHSYYTSSDYTGMIEGTVTRIAKAVVYIPSVSIYVPFSLYYYRGAMVGNWVNLSEPYEYEIHISVKIGDFDGDGVVDVDVEFNPDVEKYIAKFPLNNNLTWTMGELSSDYGYKIVRIKKKSTNETICISGEPPFCYDDVDVKLYYTRPDGVLVYEKKTKLWGDGSFRIWTKHKGKKVIRLVERSTGNVLGTSEYQEKALPRTAVYADDDPEVSFATRDQAFTRESAQTVMALLALPEDYSYRATAILSTLRGVCNDDGSLYEYYSAVLPARESPSGGASSGRWGAVWTILAVLRYTGVTGDSQFLPFARKVADWLNTTSLRDTYLAAMAYFAYRDLAVATGVSSYTTVARGLRDQLLVTNWSVALGRFKQSTTDEREDLRAVVYGGLFLLAVGDRGKAKLCMQHLKRFKVMNATVSAPHYSGPVSTAAAYPGPNKLIGYKPYANGGTNPYVNPPTVIDHSLTWAAVLFKLRYGEPAGADINSLFLWHWIKISNDPDDELFGSEFLHYSQNATSGGYNLRARPHLGPATWALVMATGAQGLFLPDPLPGPTSSTPSLAVAQDPLSNRCLARASWGLLGTIPGAAYELVFESTNNGGSSWSAVLPTATGQLPDVVDPAGNPNTYVVNWSFVNPGVSGTLYRVRVRCRNAAFGVWSPNSSAVPVTSS